jgi:hypothetical protein
LVVEKDKMTFSIFSANFLAQDHAQKISEQYSEIWTLIDLSVFKQYKK